MAEKTIKVKLIRSFYGCKPDQVNTIKSLGLGRINKTKEYGDCPEVRGMIFKVKHLVEVL